MKEEGFRDDHGTLLDGGLSMTESIKKSMEHTEINKRSFPITPPDIIIESRDSGFNSPRSPRSPRSKDPSKLSRDI